ncbi:hypothetical protein [Roseomonas sp. KE0001]|uniref:hypothetical protein n=1 Tax=Roseomonas sp. KE0001 TaxID=2479201 RepID=UPI0018DFBAD7|nr:hypothetical protein [Roseomonas sp. KE0001]
MARDAAERRVDQKPDARRLSGLDTLKQALLSYQRRMIAAIRAALEVAGVKFIAEAWGGAGTRFVRTEPAAEQPDRPDFAITIGAALDRLKPDDA